MMTHGGSGAFTADNSECPIGRARNASGGIARNIQDRGQARQLGGAGGQDRGPGAFNGQARAGRPVVGNSKPPGVGYSDPRGRSGCVGDRNAGGGARQGAGASRSVSAQYARAGLMTMLGALVVSAVLRQGDVSTSTRFAFDVIHGVDDPVLTFKVGQR